MTLRGWQVPLAARQTEVLSRERAFLQCSCTGAGKTYLACQTIRDLKVPTLVVCPKIARSQWREVIRGMGVEEYILDVINPENLVTSKKNNWYSHDEGWKNVPQGAALLVFDEIHRGCSGIYKRSVGSGKRSGSGNKQVLMVARWVNKSTPEHKVLAMSATPAESPLKMQLIGYLMGMHDFYVNSFYNWCRLHGCSYVEKNRAGAMALEFTKNRTKAREIMLGLRQDMGDKFLSITPKDIPDFPEETVETVLVDLAEKDHAALVKAYEEMPKNIREIKPGTDEMVKLLRLRQQAEFAKAEVIAQMAVEAVEDGASCFICLNFTDARLRVQAALEKARVIYASIYGGQNEKERQIGIEAFQDNRIHVMVGMSSACGVALSLHDVKHERPRVSLISPGYSCSELKQALGRIRRVGGTTATQRIVLAANSVEERVARAVNRKIDNLDALVDGDLMR
jgi:hypothetical protein